MRNSDGSEWTEIKTTGILQHSHRVRLIRRGVQINESNLVSLLASEPISEDVLRIETTLPSLPPGTVGYIVPKTRLFINKPKARDIGWDAVTAAGVYVLTGSVSLATGAQMFQRALRMMRVLSADEADIVIVMAALSGGRPYDVSVPISKIQSAYEEDSAKVAPLLAGLRKRGIAVDDGDGWRVVD
ncbi:MAG: hypothetical protein IPH27_16330 [Actinomycetales bacterium]|nr:hypothetical protein [Candidatus Phosphoribacter baldrii]MBK6956935.1 hypothetical protein [Candidatus Phosphoribacter baldrii]